MSQFDTMESTVEKICTSLYTKPQFKFPHISSY